MEPMKRAEPKPTDPGYHAGRTPANKGQTFPPEVLNPDEVRALIQAASGRAPTGIRNRALVAIMARAGLRLAEALALKPKDVDPSRGTVAILHGKGDKSRTVGLEPGAMALVERWMERRRALAVPRTAPLFCTLQGAPLKPSYVRTLLPRLAARAGIEKRVHPHALRHSLAYELAVLDAVPLPIVQRILGHASLITTQRYIDHVAPADVIAAMRSRKWTV